MLSGGRNGLLRLDAYLLDDQFVAIYAASNIINRLQLILPHNLDWVKLKNTLFRIFHPASPTKELAQSLRVEIGCLLAQIELFCRAFRDHGGLIGFDFDGFIQIRSLRVEDDIARNDEALIWKGFNSKSRVINDSGQIKFIFNTLSVSNDTSIVDALLYVSMEAAHVQHVALFCELFIIGNNL